MVSKADIMLLEARLRGLAPRMAIKLTCVKNVGMTDGVVFQFGSNGIQVDADDLEPMMDLLDTDNKVYPSAFLADYLEPFLRKHAG